MLSPYLSPSLPYSTVVYNLPEPSSNAKRCRRWKERHQSSQLSSVETVEDVDEKNTEEYEGVDKKQVAVEELKVAGDDWKAALWRCVVAFEGYTFHTSGRGSRPGVSFSYAVSRPGGAGGRHYEGTEIPGYGNELWVTTQSGSEEETKLKKSISRSTVELGYQRAAEMGGDVKGPKALGIPGGGSYVWAMLVRFGLIKKQGEA